MRYHSVGSTIRIRAEGIFFCLDPETAGEKSRILHEKLSSVARRAEIPMKTGVLSWPEELDGFPEPRFIDEMKIARRGRFITPLFEEVFTYLDERDYILIIACERVPVDAADWEEEASRIFADVSTVAPSSLGNTVEEIERQAQEYVRKRQLSRVELYCMEGIFHEWPEGFELHIEGNAMRLIKEAALIKADIPLGVHASGQKATVSVNDEKELRIDTRKAKPVGFDRALSEPHSEAFIRTISLIRKGAKEFPCVRCGQEHEFSRPFHCERTRSVKRVFSRGEVIFADIEEGRASADYAVFKSVDGRIHWGLAKGRIVCLGDEDFFAWDEAGKAYMLKLKGRALDARELEEISPGLVQTGSDTYVLSLYFW